MTTTEQLAEDVATLCARAFENKSITYFGADGLGKYGQAEHPQTSTIVSMDIRIVVDDENDPTEITCAAHLELSGYDASVTGHVVTDQNFKIGLNQLCEDAAIDIGAFAWAPIDLQTDTTVCLLIDVPLLLSW